MSHCRKPTEIKMQNQKLKASVDDISTISFEKWLGKVIFFVPNNFFLSAKWMHLCNCTSWWWCHSATGSHSFNAKAHRYS